MSPKPTIHDVELLPREEPHFWHDDIHHVLSPRGAQWGLYASYRKGSLTPVATVGQRPDGSWTAIPANGGQVEITFEDWRAAVLHAIITF